MAGVPGIGPLQGSYPSELPRLGAAEETKDGPSFGDTLGGMIRNVDGMVQTAHDAARRMLTGEIEDVHQVMVAMEEAQTSFHLMMEVRNKIVEAYREVMRMQV